VIEQLQCKGVKILLFKDGTKIFKFGIHYVGLICHLAPDGKLHIPKSRCSKSQAPQQNIQKTLFN
ncbi:MAG: hypothetical protein KAS07_03090, partial [Candidatus Pacebacteria bacterium]|nr:hypothetical protein [Candidatus Paceibacterota bacterium]